MSKPWSSRPTTSDEIIAAQYRTIRAQRKMIAALEKSEVALRFLHLAERVHHAHTAAKIKGDEATVSEYATVMTVIGDLANSLDNPGTASVINSLYERYVISLVARAPEQREE